MPVVNLLSLNSRLLLIVFVEPIPWNRSTIEDCVLQKITFGS